MRTVIAMIAWIPAGSAACGSCRPSVRATLFTPDFFPTLAAMLLPAVLVGLLAAAWMMRES